MLGFFPTPYPDELLYSVIARFRVRAGILSPKMVIEELFNSRTAAAIVDLPCNLIRLCSNLPIGSNLSPDYLIDKHTLFPLYKPFVFQERARKVHDAMLGSYGGNIHNLFGTTASTVKYPAYLRFCPICWKEEQNRYGEGYWHRLHQIPGVEVCPLHQVLLSDSNVEISQYNKHEFIPASSSSCIPKLTEFLYSTKAFKELIGIARDIEWIINNKIIIKSLIWLQEQYIQSLITKKLATAMGRVYQIDLKAAFKCYYGDDLLKKLQSSVSEDNEGWLSELVRKPRKIFHPLRHVLLIRFLSSTVPLFFVQNNNVKPFGNGPWPCLNAAAEHYHKEMVENIVITYCYETKLPVGTFSCSCGFVYSRRGPDSSPDDRYKIGRIKDFGPVWRKKLKILIEQGFSARSIARTLKVDTKTVQKYSKAEEPITQTNLEINFVQNSENNRKDVWLSLCSQHPEASVSSLRKLNPALYMWLYRHEKEWLLNNSLRMDSKGKNETQRINWENRDIQLCKEIKGEVSKILSGEGKPQRITVSLLGKRLGILSLLEKKISKLPQTNKYLSFIVESVEDYQKRRIYWAVKMLISKNNPLVVWRVKRMAGIGKCSVGMNDFIETAIGDLSSNVRCGIK